VQVVIALIVTPEGFPIAYEVLSGNTADKTTLRDFLKEIETQYGKADRIWIMVPTEEVLEEMRKNDPPVSYLVGTPKGRLSALEKDLLACPWKNARPSVQGKLLAKDGKTYVLAQSEDRIAKERSMRSRRLRKYLKALADLNARKTPLGRDAFHQALGAAKLWEYYPQLTEIEQAFKELKGDLAIRPIHHQLEHCVESRLFISFLAYCLQVTLKARLESRASGLTSRAVLEKFSAVQMLDVHLPTTDGREIVLTRYTQPEKDLLLLLEQLKTTLPEQAPPKIYSHQLR